MIVRGVQVARLRHEPRSGGCAAMRPIRRVTSVQSPNGCEELPWQPILVGVDRSPEALAAAWLAWEIAQRSGAPIHLVKVIRVVSIPPTSGGPLLEISEINRLLRQTSRARTKQVLSRHLPAEIVELMEVRGGRTGPIIARMVQYAGAGLVVLGGKRHGALGGWIGGSTAQDLTCVAGVPVLVTVDSRTKIRRVLAVACCAGCEGHVVRLGRRFAHLFDASYWVLWGTGALAPASGAPGHAEVDLVKHECGDPEESPCVGTKSSHVDCIAWEHLTADVVRQEIQEWDADRWSRRLAARPGWAGSSWGARPGGSSTTCPRRFSWSPHRRDELSSGVFAPRAWPQAPPPCPLPAGKNSVTPCTEDG